MTLNEATQEKIYDKLRSFDGIEVAGHEPVNASIASVLSEGEVLADTGEQYTSIQDAVDASTGWTFVGPGTYYENVTIDKDDFTLKGAGYDTLIDGGHVNPATQVYGSNVKLKSFSAKTARNGSVSGADAITTQSSNTFLEGITVRDAGSDGIRGEGTETICKNCIIETTEGWGIHFDGERSIINSCIVQESGNSTYEFADGLRIDGDDSIISSSISRDALSEDGLQTSGNDSIIIGCRVINSNDFGIKIKATDCIIANNRISGSGTSDIDDQGTGTVLDANLTGSAN